MKKTKYIFCDESRYVIDDKTDQYMVLGALSLDSNDKDQIKARIKELLAKYKYKSEIKWSILSDRRLAVYKDLIKLLKEEKLDVRAVIVDKTKVDLQKYHNNNEELSHAKFTYFLLRELVLDEDTDYVIILDYKDRDIRNRLKELKRILSLNCPPTSKIIQLQESPSF